MGKDLDVLKNGLASIISGIEDQTKTLANFLDDGKYPKFPDELIKKQLEEIGNKNKEEAEIRRLTLEKLRKEGFVSNGSKKGQRVFIENFIRKVITDFKFTKFQKRILLSLAKSDSLSMYQLKEKVKCKNILSMVSVTNSRIRDYQLQEKIYIHYRTINKVKYFQLDYSQNLFE